MNVADSQTVEDLIRAVPAEHRSLFEEFVQARADAKRVREMSARLDDANAEMREMKAGWAAHVAAGEKAHRQSARLDALEAASKALNRELDSLKEQLRSERSRVVTLSRQVDIANAERKRLGLTV